MSSYTTTIVAITACLDHAPKKCTQSGNFQFDIKSPFDIKILSAEKLKTLFEKYKLELTTGIHTCIGHVLRINYKDICTATEMIPTIEMISATEMTPNHHRNDNHHLNDPRNIGNGIKRTTKTGQQFSACFLFIYIASFLRCVIYLLPHFILQ